MIAHHSFTNCTSKIDYVLHKNPSEHPTTLISFDDTASPLKCAALGTTMAATQ